MRITYFAVSTRLGPSSRYRIYQYQNFFNNHDHRLIIAPALGDKYFQAERFQGFSRWWRRLIFFCVGLFRRLLQLRHLCQADLIIIEREFFAFIPPVFEWLIHLSRQSYVLELDDAIYLQNGRRRKYPHLLRMAKAVIVGNESLANHCLKYNKNVHVIPTTISIKRYPKRKHYKHASLARIGWVGLAYNYPHLHTIASALTEVCRLAPAKLVILSARPEQFAFPYELVMWQENKETEIISSFDIGIMPLRDTAFARGKCGLKLMQYMACGIPSVASPVGVNKQIIKHNENGLLATTADEWREALLSLLNDETLRQRLGQSARVTIEKKYSLEVWGPRLVRLYEEFYTSPFKNNKAGATRILSGVW
ncbi:MAG: glycosyltransferase family 4 protein [Deltaproteobacteria bacterium]|nr:glycosyltransferase family 4 protein [Deltaproteobacteria bacterium]